MRVSRQLPRSIIIALLREVGEELHTRGIEGRLFVVGGAAMALAYNSRRITADVDGVFEPKLAVYEAARTVASRHRALAPDWLNDAVKGLIPAGAEHAARVVFRVPGMTVVAPSPYTLIAMKALSARLDRDQDDLRALAKIVGVSTASGVLDIVERYAGGQHLTPKSQFFVEQTFPGPQKTRCDGRTKAGRRCVLSAGHRGYHRGVIR